MLLFVYLGSAESLVSLFYRTQVQLQRFLPANWRVCVRACVCECVLLGLQMAFIIHVYTCLSLQPL